MPDLKNDEIVLQRAKRNFIQYGSPTPGNVVRYAGQNAQYMSLDGVTIPGIGSVDPVWVHDPNRIGGYKLVSRSITPPDLASGTLVMREKHGAVPRALLRGCVYNVYELTGACGNLSDFLSGWSDYVLIYSGAITTSVDGGTRSSFDGDDPIENSADITLSAVYPIGSLGFGEGAASQVDQDVVDIVFGAGKPCDDCANGDQWIYAITNSSGVASPGLPAEIIYTTDKGGTWAQANITGFGATETAYWVDIVGNYLIVGGAAAYYWSEINQQTGVPGAFTKVVTTVQLNDVYVAGPREVYFAENTGKIYKATDITAGVVLLSSPTANALSRIHGQGETIVAVGALGTVVVSHNRGTTFSTVTTAPSATTVQAVFVLDDDLYWIGTVDGNVFWTDTDGEIWHTVTFSGYGTGEVTDIVFATREVGYFAHSTAAPVARVFTTWNGGADWTKAAPRILNMPTYDVANRIATPNTGDPGWASNTVAIAGLAGNAIDGIVLIGASSIL
jgi:hypothetical protein